MEQKQTAVEWLVEQLGENGFISTYESIKRDELQSIIQQAKEMQKQQIIDAWTDGNDSEIRGGKVMRIMREKYYNEEYGKE